MNATEIFDTFIDASRKMIRIDLAQQELARCRDNAAPKCGNCSLWMTRGCAPEQKALERFPLKREGKEYLACLRSSNSPTCNLYEPKPCVVEWQQKAADAQRELDAARNPK